ncbi:hypothetical protein NG697_12510 [Pseudarthrobacter sp. MDT3-26]|uniref:hypothetical protein n=1 Tax=Pseudarthrobacter raffinosi TaxID=2953651 RepID=UPI00208DFA0E|nr:hypothetical protein [Pseudarthrobacter sp. MDT3-26]MCO4263734.1 hypothetical protein [Pseudarthrobacter sp. MDT3-26]
MTGIGITLDDLGIDNGSTGNHTTTRKTSGYPKEYDFSLELALYGSWRDLRDALYVPAEEGFRVDHRETPLWFALYWAQTENETEESIKAALTGLRYDESVHNSLHEHLYNWARDVVEEDQIRLMVAPGMPHQEPVRQGLAANESTPQDVLEELKKDARKCPEMLYALLENPALAPTMVRGIHARIKDQGWKA